MKLRQVCFSLSFLTTTMAHTAFANPVNIKGKEFIDHIRQYVGDVELNGKKPKGTPFVTQECSVSTRIVTNDSRRKMILHFYYGGFTSQRVNFFDGQVITKHLTASEDGTLTVEHYAYNDDTSNIDKWTTSLGFTIADGQKTLSYLSIKRRNRGTPIIHTCEFN